MLKVGIIGLGVGEQHIIGYQQHPACEVVMLCDFSPEKQAAIAPRYPQMIIVADAKDVLTNSSIDVVSIASCNPGR